MLKNKIEELVILGGQVSLPETLHVGRPNIGRKESFLKRAENILDSKWLSNGGPYVQEFEKKIADYIGIKHCIAMCNGTTALENTIRALGLKGEVIVPSFTFIATPNSLKWQEITPVFCDIDPNTHNIDPDQIERLITPNTTGIIGVHLWGRPCNIEALESIAEKHKIKLFFDAAHAFGCSYQSKMIGNFGIAEAFSFHATKFLNTFEGGAVVTDNDELARQLRLMKNFGFTDYDKVNLMGVNGKMSEISAAMGLTGLESIDNFIQMNKKNYHHYKSLLAPIKGIKHIEYNEGDKNNFQYIILEINEKETGIGRDDIIRILFHENIIARRYFYPGCHNMETYRAYFPNAKLLLTETDKLIEKVFALPTGPAVTLENISTICQLIDLIIQNGPTIKEKISKLPVKYNFKYS